jgi:hypothetical protein
MRSHSPPRHGKGAPPRQESRARCQRNHKQRTANREATHSPSLILTLPQLFGNALDGMVLLAVALADDARLERSAVAARRATDVWQVACFVHAAAEDFAGMAGVAWDGGGGQ